jgi:hypothetical protein
MNKDWQLKIGYQGKRFHVWGGLWQVVVYVDVLARRRRFTVLEFSREQSRHQTLAEAKAQVLQRLIALAQA